MVKTTNKKAIGASFRDPEGFVFEHKGAIFRQINQAGKDNFDLFISSGLYQHLVDKKWLIRHKESNQNSANPHIAYKVINAEKIFFLSYPYEWSFSQLKDAALLTLDIQIAAIEHGMSLKDASAYNVQFDIESAKPIFIDSLSFQALDVRQAWIAYRQFCQHFLAPLALMAYQDVRLLQLLRSNIDGLALDLTVKLLPKRAFLSSGIFTHIYLHAKAQKAFADSTEVRDTRKSSMTKTQHLGILDGLRRSVSTLKQRKDLTEWANYYSETNYDDAAFTIKKNLVRRFIKKVKPASVWDIGGNTGEFSRIASRQGIPTISFDIDPNAIEANYILAKSEDPANILPLVIDLNNPSPNLGWNNEERSSIYNRGKADLILALALIHHLAISNNLPLERLASFFSHLSPWLIIEFVPKSDSQVKRLLSSRKDIFPDYTLDGFQKAFSEYYTFEDSKAIENSERRLYLMKRK